jgi:RNA polymerase sigma-70 factor, ECF subfamily
LAEDYTQEIFLRVIRYHDNFNNSMCFSSWLYTIAKNYCKNQLRYKKTRPETFSSEYFQIIDQTADSTANIYNKELNDIIQIALNQLGERMREFFVLREIEKLSYTEIAEIMQCKEGSVRTQISRAKQQLRKTLKVYMELEK